LQQLLSEITGAEKGCFNDLMFAGGTDAQGWAEMLAADSPCPAGKKATTKVHLAGTEEIGRELKSALLEIANSPMLWIRTSKRHSSLNCQDFAVQYGSQ